MTGLGLAACAVSPLLMMPSSLPAVLAGAALFGCGLPWIIVGSMTLLQRLTPPDLQGRAAGAAELMTSTSQTFSIALGAGLLTVLDYRILLGMITGFVALSAGYLLTRPEHRRAARSPTPTVAVCGDRADAAHRDRPSGPEHPVG